jgi:polar amino acid transport system substrate-binding protein
MEINKNRVCLLAGVVLVVLAVILIPLGLKRLPGVSESEAGISDEQKDAKVMEVTASSALSGKSEASDDESSAAKDNTFILAANQPLDSPLSKFWNLVYTEVLRPLDIQLELSFYPLARASYVADMGLVDGEPARIYNYAGLHPDLVRVDEPVYSFSIVAFAADPSISELNGWESLRDTDYMVEYARGAVLPRDRLIKVVKEENLTSIATAPQGLKRLAFKMTDVYVDMDDIMPLLQDLSLQEKIRVVGLMESMPLYMYVHKKHQALVPQLKESIKALNEEGVIQQYRDDIFGISKKKEVRE